VSEALRPERYENVRKPLLEAEGMPPEAYYDPAFYRREVDTIFTRSWILVGREDRLAAGGDYFTIDFAGLQLVLVRDLEGTLRAFSNSCRHRGARLLEGSGRCRGVVCPYHAWTYGLDGTLRTARGMEQTIGFRTEDYPLVALRVATWGGFVFVCADPAAPPLDATLGDLASLLAPYRFEDMRSARRLEFDVKCNWKAWVENFMEGYHIPTVHRRTISKFKAINVPQTRGRGEYDLIWERHPGTLALLDGDAGFAPIESLEGETAEGSRFAIVYPNAMIAMTIDAMWSFECHPTGAETSRVVLTSCFPKSRFEQPDFDALARNYFKRQDIVVGEDNAIAEVQHAGLRSPLARPGRFSAKEPIVHALDNWVLDRVFGPRPSASLRAVG
jgi:choline monooxygenase